MSALLAVKDSNNKKTISVMKSLANATRLEIVRDLARCPSGESCGKLSEKKFLSQPTMSHHFLKLVTAGVIFERKTGTQKSYVLNKPLLESVGVNINKL